MVLDSVDFVKKVLQPGEVYVIVTNLSIIKYDYNINVKLGKHTLIHSFTEIQLLMKSTRMFPCL